MILRVEFRTGTKDSGDHQKAIYKIWIKGSFTILSDLLEERGNLQIMVNATENGHLREYRNMIKNQMCGATAQLWSCAGFVNACIRGGLTEIDPEKILMR